MKTSSLLFTAFLFASASCALADDVTLTAYYPAPNGNYVNITSTNATFTNLSATNAAIPTISGATTVNGLLTSSGVSCGISIVKFGVQKASISSGGAITAQSLTTTSTITGNSLTILDNTGTQTAAISALGGISGTSLNTGSGTISTTGAITGATLATTGAITGATLTTTGAITGGTISTSGGGITTPGTLQGGYLSVGSSGINSTGSLALWNNGTQFAGITTAGAITGTSLVLTGNITATNITATTDVSAQGRFLYASDARLKTDVAPITAALNKVSQLHGVYYTLKARPGEKRIGLIAQDAEPIVPEVVRTGKDGFKSVDYASLTALLIEGMKEQQAQIDALNVRIHQLETRK